MVLHVITYRSHYPRQGLTQIKYDVNVPDMVLHVITYRCQCPRRGLTREHISESYVMIYISYHF
ncbi:hypothetical protein F383_31734 [Gossypium arboreum]|uniref:Uncharacterized protein n=1 Tax=Gossypium arboreum TaxID=29729 RepID=A0A0B0MUB7_GOSAR|nr:hypothetical protein F383_31734 [Gossypium arboreum]